jgi:hypothetical protein
VNPLTLTTQTRSSSFHRHAITSRRSLGKKVVQVQARVDFRDAWRYKGIFSTWERFRPKHTFPGLGIGTGAFIIYLAADFLMKPSHAHEKSDH